MMSSAGSEIDRYAECTPILVKSGGRATPSEMPVVRIARGPSRGRTRPAIAAPQMMPNEKGTNARPGLHGREAERALEVEGERQKRAEERHADQQRREERAAPVSIEHDAHREQRVRGPKLDHDEGREQDAGSGEEPERDRRGPPVGVGGREAVDEGEEAEP